MSALGSQHGRALGAGGGGGGGLISASAVSHCGIEGKETPRVKEEEVRHHSAGWMGVWYIAAVLGLERREPVWPSGKALGW